MPLFDFKCDKHGVFEASHPICPEMGCASENVEKVFLKAPGYKSDMSKRIDASTRQSAEMYNLRDIRSPRIGESSYGGDAEAAYGKKVLWGDEIGRVSGVSMQQMAKNAAQPFTVTKKDGRKETVEPGMYLAAREAGLTKNALPPTGEKTISAKEQQMRNKVQSANS